MTFQELQFFFVIDTIHVIFRNNRGVSHRVPVSVSRIGVWLPMVLHGATGLCGYLEHFTCPFRILVQSDLAVTINPRNSMPNTISDSRNVMIRKLRKAAALEISDRINIPDTFLSHESI